MLYKNEYAAIVNKMIVKQNKLTEIVTNVHRYNSSVVLFTSNNFVQKRNKNLSVRCLHAIHWHDLSITR